MSMKDQTERWLLAACTPQAPRPAAAPERQSSADQAPELARGAPALLAQIRSVYARVREELQREIRRSA